MQVALRKHSTSSVGGGGDPQGVKRISDSGAMSSEGGTGDVSLKIERREKRGGVSPGS